MASNCFLGNKICRACLRSCENPIHIFSDSFISDKCLQECFEELCDVTVQPDDNLPESICSKCFYLLEESLNFRHIVRKNNEFLHKIVQKNEVTEYVDAITDECSADDTVMDNPELIPKDVVAHTDQLLDNDDIFIIKEELLDEGSPIDDFPNEEEEGDVKFSPVTEYVSNVQQLDHNQVITSKNKPNEKQYVCTFCPQTFLYSRNKRQHERRHTEEGSHPCSLCNLKFFTKSELRRHISVHMNERQFKCYICSRNFFTQSELNRHLKLHETIKKHKCEICTKEFSLVSFLNFHIKTVHLNERRHFCDVCGKSFITLSKVNRHKKSRFCIETKFAKTVHKNDEIQIMVKG